MAFSFRLSLTWAGWSGFNSQMGQEIFSYSKHPDQLWVIPSHLFKGHLAVLSLGIKQLEHEADHSPPSSDEFKTSGPYLPLLCSVVFWVVSGWSFSVCQADRAAGTVKGLTQNSCKLYYCYLHQCMKFGSNSGMHNKWWIWVDSNTHPINPNPCFIPSVGRHHEDVYIVM